jgi:hypothetical protein
VFLQEKVLYTAELLEKHKKEGDKLFNIKPHPVCDYCKTTFFSEEELYIHCKENHETCFICDRYFCDSFFFCGVERILICWHVFPLFQPLASVACPSSREKKIMASRFFGLIAPFSSLSGFHFSQSSLPLLVVFYFDSYFFSLLGKE